jgi:alpha-tubulin suppressor-like RCC1 family protein
VNRKTVGALCALAFVAACQDHSTPSGPPPIGPAAHVTLISSDTVSGPFGAMLATPMTVKATDANGHAVSGAHVAFASTGGSVTPIGATTNANGEASTTIVLPIAYGVATYTATVNSLPPVSVHGTSHGAVFATVSAGFNETCATTIEGYLYCWGDNGANEIGLDTSATTLTPQPIPSAAQFVMIQEGPLSGCGVDRSSNAWCWGGTQSGLLGNGVTRVGWSPPVRVSGGLTFSEVSTGYYYACGVTTSGAVYCWGANSSGEAGPTGCCNSTNATPVLVPTPVPIVHLSASNLHTCGLSSDGTAYCWGSNANGELGTTATLTQRCDSLPCSPTPVPVAGGLHFRSISAAYESTCGLTTSGVGYCWGNNDFGQLGNGTQTSAATPTPIAVGNAPVAQLSAIDRLGCVVTTAPTILCWGYGVIWFGVPNVQCPVPGNPGSFYTCQPTPTAPSTGGMTFTAISVGDDQMCGFPSGSTLLYCWGAGFAGDLGDGTTTDELTPTLVSDQE